MHTEATATRTVDAFVKRLYQAKSIAVQSVQ